MRSKNEMMSLNNQLLEAIQRKLVLSQELEAWQVGSLLRLNMLLCCASASWSCVAQVMTLTQPARARS